MPPTLDEDPSSWWDAPWILTDPHIGFLYYKREMNINLLPFPKREGSSKIELPFLVNIDLDNFFDKPGLEALRDRVT